MMADPQGISEEMSTLPAPDASGNAYGTFKKDRASEDAMANETQSSVRDDNGDDEWSKIRQEYGKQSQGRLSGLFSFLQRLPVHWSVILVVFLSIVALCLFLVFGLSQPVKKPQPLATHHAKSALSRFAVKRTAVAANPSSTTSFKSKVSSSSKPAPTTQQGLVQQQATVLQKRKEEKAEAAKKRLEKLQKREEERKAEQELLTVRPTDSPEVRNAIQRAEQQQTNVAFQRERVTVAENNLVPLQQVVNGRQAAFDAENQQYLSWKKKMDQDKEELNGIVNSRQEIDKRLAQLKVLGRREKDNMPGMRQKILQAEKKQGVALQQSDRFSKLARKASIQLQETMQAEKDDEAEIAREKLYIQQQQKAAKNGMIQSQELMSKTTGLEETIARLTPVVDNLYKEYQAAKNAKVQAGLYKLDERRQSARTELNKYIRERERMEELPKTPERIKKIKEVSKKLVASQKNLGTLYSNEESDREALKASVEAEEEKTPVYLGYLAKNKLLQTARQRLSSISAQADQIRMQAEIAEQSASEATQKTARTETTDALLKNSERRLRVKEKAFDKESSYQLANAKGWEQKADVYRKAITDEKSKLTSETVKGEEYLENIMSGHEKRDAVENRIAQEKKAFENEALLRNADKQQLQQAEMQYDAAKAVVKNLKQQVQLAKAMAWKADMQVKEERQNEQLQNSIQYAQQQQQMQQQQQPPFQFHANQNNQFQQIHQQLQYSNQQQHQQHQQILQSSFQQQYPNQMQLQQQGFQSSISHNFQQFSGHSAMEKLKADLLGQTVNTNSNLSNVNLNNLDSKGFMGTSQVSGANSPEYQNKFNTANTMPMDYFSNPLNIPIAGTRQFGVITPDLNSNVVQAHQNLEDKFVTNQRRDRMLNRECASEAGSPCRSVSGSPTGRRCTSTSPIRRAIRSQKVASTPQPPSVDMMTCCVQLMAHPGQPSARVTQALEAFAARIKAGQREEAMRAAKRSKGLVDGHTDELADTLAKIGVDDEEEDKKIGQSPIERHKLLAWRPPTNGKINIDVFKSKDGTSHSVNVKGAKSWSEFQEAVTQLVQAVRELVPDVDIKQNQARVALTKSSFHIGHCIDIGNLNIADNFAEVCTRKKKGGEAALGKTAKTNGGLVLKLHKWNAKVMLHGNGRGDMWWPTSDLENMTDAYNELCAHLNSSGHPHSPSSSVSSPVQHPLDSDLMPPPQPLVRKGGSFKKKMSDEGQTLFVQAPNPAMHNQALDGFKGDSPFSNGTRS